MPDIIYSIQYLAGAEFGRRGGVGSAEEPVGATLDGLGDSGHQPAKVLVADSAAAAAGTILRTQKASRHIKGAISQTTRWGKV